MMTKGNLVRIPRYEITILLLHLVIYKQIHAIFNIILYIRKFISAPYHTQFGKKKGFMDHCCELELIT